VGAEDLPEEDRRPEPSPDDPFMPIVESLVKQNISAAELEDALAVAGPAERDEALRLLNQESDWMEERRDAIRKRLDELDERYGFGSEDAPE
jgi:hypothetical protein